MQSQVFRLKENDQKQKQEVMAGVQFESRASQELMKETIEKTPPPPAVIKIYYEAAVCQCAACPCDKYTSLRDVERECSSVNRLFVNGDGKKAAKHYVRCLGYGERHFTTLDG